MTHFTNRLEFYVIIIAIIASLGMVAQPLSDIIRGADPHQQGATLGTGTPEFGNPPLDAIMGRLSTSGNPGAILSP